MIIYIVNRYEMPISDPGIDVFFEKAFVSEDKAKEYIKALDPEDLGFKYICPCSCGDEHYRYWDIVPGVLEE